MVWKQLRQIVFKLGSELNDLFQYHLDDIYFLFSLYEYVSIIFIKKPLKYHQSILVACRASSVFQVNCGTCTIYGKLRKIYPFLLHGRNTSNSVYKPYRARMVLGHIAIVDEFSRSSTVQSTASNIQPSNTDLTGWTGGAIGNVAARGTPFDLNYNRASPTAACKQSDQWEASEMLQASTARLTPIWWKLLA